MKFDPEDVTVEKGWMGMGKGDYRKAVHWPTKTTVSRHVPVEVPLPESVREVIQELKDAVEKIKVSS